MLSDEKDASLKQAKHHRKASYPSSGVEKVMPDDCSTGIQAESIRVDESRLDGADVSAERPISPGTLALMCDEQDTIFTTAAAPPNDLTSLSNNTSFQLPHGQGMAEIYPELERIVLAQTQEKCSSMVRDTDSGRQNNVSSNGVANTVPPPPPPQQKVDSGTTAANNACPKVHPPDGNRDVKEKI
ncbi:hypothetical protein MTR67_030758 [Solanum verrucosum]|uniref:Uncharacterized protein n=1 Tax=Solanum verrucosum TaxID=315347 RepID=A0AAF0U180_SOLVR|nr:hypothetical protein MTR67_030758 [Solanum verrucosum]